MSEPQLKSVPSIQQVRDLFGLSPSVTDLERAEDADGFDGSSTRFRYRFFRDGEMAPFSSSSDRFQTLNAWYLSDAAFLAYADATFPEEVAARISAPLQRFFSFVQRRDGREAPVRVKVFIAEGDRSQALVDPVQCYMADDGVVGIVAFRGTLPTSIPNWLTDFNAVLTPWRGASGPGVHAGFATAALALLDGTQQAPGLRSYLKRRLQEAPNLQLWFTGHSLGAALATLAAYDIGNVRALYTFGSPRVGNLEFAHAFARSDVPHYRVVHHNDVVTHVPFPLPLLGFEHVGNLEYIEYADASVEQTTMRNQPMSKLFDGSALERQLGSIFANAHEALFDVLGRLKIGFPWSKISGFTDHAPLYYSNLLWNGFVKDRARLLGRVDPVAAARGSSEPRAASQSEPAAAPGRLG